MKHLIPDLAFTIRFEHTYRLQNGMELKPGINYHYETDSYVTPWNMDKHLNDEWMAGKITSASHWKITLIKDQHGKCSIIS